MKTLCFINASKTIQRILNDSTHSRSASVYQAEEWELKFSTFRSEDYQFYDDLPRFHDRGGLVEDSIEQLSYQLESDEESDYSQNQEIAKIQVKKGFLKKLCFRNSKTKIMKCLQENVSIRKKLSFRNRSEVISGFFPTLSKVTD